MPEKLIISLAVILVILIAIAAAIYIIRRQLRKMSRSMFGTDSFAEGINKQKAELSETPRSLQAMTNIYLPMIKKDFPEFDYGAYKRKTESLLQSWFSAVSQKNTSLLREEYSLTLKNSVQAIIEDLNSRNVTQVFNQITVHNTEIARYIKNGATVTILFVTSVGCISYCEDEDGNVIFGDRDNKKQTVYETELVYVQDADKLDSIGGESLGINCPNCGAPIKNLGSKFCEYCGTGVTEVNIRAWKYHSVREQK